MNALTRMPKRERELTWCEKVLVDIRTKVFLALMLMVFTGFFIPYFYVRRCEELIQEKRKNEKCLLEHELRIDCLPGLLDSERSQEECEKIGCCWEEFGYTVPSCFHPHPTKYTYRVVSVQDTNGTGYRLRLAASFDNNSLHGTPAAQNLTVDIQYVTADHLRLLLHDGSSATSEKYLKHPNEGKVSSSSTNYHITFPKTGKFTLAVKRKVTSGSSASVINPAIFNTAYGPLIFSKGYAELTTLLPSFDIFGVGQNAKNSFRHDLRYTKKHILFSRVDETVSSTSSAQFSSGVQPFYLVLEKGGRAHGVLLLTSVPLEIVTRGSPSVTFRAAESRLDFHLFMGPSPDKVVRQLTHFIGRPYMPPYWALGYHSCRKSLNLKRSMEFLNFTRSRRIPHESDCISSNAVISSLLGKIPLGLNSVIYSLKSSGRKLLPFLTPHVPVDVINQGHFDKFRNLVFVRSSTGRYPFTGYTENGQEVLYPDVFNDEETKLWFKEHFQKMFSSLDFDGLFLDLNTPTNAGANETQCANSSDIYPFLSPVGNSSDRTLCMDALHKHNVPHGYLHNMYGYKHLDVIKGILDEHTNHAGKRHFLCSLSTFPGSASLGCHWSGYVSSSWESLKQSVIQMLDFSLFGMPMFGVPVCGTNGRRDSDLCSRWLQVAAFQPLFTTYSVDENELLFNHRRLTSVGRSALQLRYSLLPYLYGLFYNSSKYGSTVVRPLFFEFPEVKETYGLDEQFMWGSGLLVSPALKHSGQKIKAFFPPGCWYDYYTGRLEAETNTGVYRELLSVENHVNLHVRGGHIVPSQVAKLTTGQTRQQNFSVSVALNCLRRQEGKGKVIDNNKILAVGEIFIDDGASTNGLMKDEFLLVSIVMKGKTLTFQPTTNNLPKISGENLPSTILNKLHFYGIPEKPSECFINGILKDIPYNSVFESLVWDDLNLDLRNNHTIECR